MENTWGHNADEIADALRECWEETGAGLLLLVGDPRERRAVHDRLPQQLREACAESGHGSGTPLLDSEIEAARAAATEAYTAQAMERYRAARGGAGGPQPDTAEGVPAVVEAAREHAIGTLLVEPDGSDTKQEVWVGPGPDQVAVRRSDVRYLGEVRPEPARADDALLRSAAATGAEVLVVHQPGGGPVGGVGALLRRRTENS